MIICKSHPSDQTKVVCAPFRLAAQCLSHSHVEPRFKAKCTRWPPKDFLLIFSLNQIPATYQEFHAGKCRRIKCRHVSARAFARQNFHLGSHALTKRRVFNGETTEASLDKLVIGGDAKMDFNQRKLFFGVLYLKKS